MKTFRPYQPDQLLLLPPNLNEWLPEDHLAAFVNEAVEQFDLKEIYKSYDRGGAGGQPPYDPRMMVKILLYGYCTGCHSSRKIERATWEDVGFRVLAANQHPDHDSIADFRKRHLQALRGLFLQVLKLAQKAGLVRLGHVALDSTLVRANASKHKAMSYQRMVETEARLKREIEELFKRAEETDKAEDRKYGKGKRGDEWPEELKRRETRLEKIRKAMKELEEEARQQAEQEKAKTETQAEKTGKGKTGTKAKKAAGTPDPKAQKNFTDADSRIMRDGNSKSFEQSYKAQAVVDSENQIIVAAAVTQENNDKKQLVPMLKKTRENTKKSPKKLSADAGYFSDESVTHKSIGKTELYIPPKKRGMARFHQQLKGVHPKT